MYNPRRVMEECLAIKPDLIFLWDEAWFGFARFSPFHRRRTAMGAAAALNDALREPGLPRGVRGARGRSSASSTRKNPQSARHAPAARPGQGAHPRLPDQLDAQVDVGAPAGLDDPGRGTRTSTRSRARSRRRSSPTPRPRPNLQLIASLDVARRQMELEGLRAGACDATELAIALRRRVNSHPLISKYFRVADAGGDDPGRVPRLRHRRTTARRTRPGRTCSTPGTRTSSPSTRRASRWSAARPASTARSSRACWPSRFDIQINKTSRNSVLVQTNINNTRSDVALLIKVLADLSREIEQRLAQGGAAERRRLRRAREVADDGRAGPAELQPLPRRVPRRSEGQRRNEGHMRAGVLHGLRRGELRVRASSPARRSTSA